MRELTKLTTDFWIFERNMPRGGYGEMEKSQKKRKKRIEPPHSMRIIFSPFAAFSSCRLYILRDYSGHANLDTEPRPKHKYQTDCTALECWEGFFSLTNLSTGVSYLFTRATFVFLSISPAFFFYYTRALLLCSYSQNLQRFPRSSCLLAQRLFHPRQDRGTENVAVASKQEIKTREERVPSETHSLEDLKHHYMNTENTGCQLYLYQTFFFSFVKRSNVVCVFWISILSWVLCDVGNQCLTLFFSSNLTCCASLEGNHISRSSLMDNSWNWMEIVCLERDVLSEKRKKKKKDKCWRRDRLERSAVFFWGKWSV